MRALSASLSVKLLVTALFLWVQAVAMAHAAEAGEDPHEHYGVSCELHAVAAEVAPLPAAPPELPALVRSFTLAEHPVAEFRPWSRPPGRGPPPRGPPHFDQ